ncbi:unnamed protein product [Paramecium pentaurelia]|uniref:Uncharacterized protein n=1 Tax=Paramecium pentaurelia TaxID=43138 RepID=A0A8S1Y9H6_9CILI|nr:unnamed protein product [Paramecium pentaurelia]
MHQIIWYQIRSVGIQYGIQQHSFFKFDLISINFVFS